MYKKFNFSTILKIQITTNEGIHWNGKTKTELKFPYLKKKHKFKW